MTLLLGVCKIFLGDLLGWYQNSRVVVEAILL